MAKTDAERMSDKIFMDLYDIALEHAEENPQRAAEWFEENFDAADGFVEWLGEYRPHLLELWADGHFDE